MYGGVKPGQDKLDKLKEVLGWMNDFVANGKFAAGTSHMTLADISLLVTYSFIKVFPCKLKKYICQSDPFSVLCSSSETGLCSQSFLVGMRT